MDLKRVKDFIDLARKEGLSDLSYEAEDLKISLSFPQQNFVTSQEQIKHVQKQISNNDTSYKKEESARTQGDTHDHVITSPFVGTLYLCPSPGKPQYVRVGDKIKKGQTLCILEAMKIMNEIESDADGVIVDICEENESLVEFNQPLFKIRKN